VDVRGRRDYRRVAVHMTLTDHGRTLSSPNELS
jgi:hypothetical protein